MRVKTICNDTEHPIQVTLYVSGRSNSDVTQTPYGTRSVELEPGQISDVNFGDIRHNYLHGVKLEANIEGTKVINQGMVDLLDSVFDRVINNEELLEISRLRQLLVSPV
ncbi:hypothetical protein [Aliamphritea spongicola]|uniref:hypothetical protein n=1 Tax=Aliamphritea spongicola TaxID=707589 RepID=UPI00196ABFA0|nr:hypothetical protein [Aliamphritea spongicola]MBN3564853.1 hypothetical protein [Aliamphritea spongicola]